MKENKKIMSGPDALYMIRLLITGDYKRLAYHMRHLDYKWEASEQGLDYWMITVSTLDAYAQTGKPLRSRPMKQILKRFETLLTDIR